MTAPSRSEQIAKPDDLAFTGGWGSCVVGHIDEGAEGSVTVADPGEGPAGFWHEWPDGRVADESEFVAPAIVPDDWRPREEDAVWGFCKSDAPGATKLYICEER